MDYHLGVLDGFELEQIAEAFNAAYEGYVMPVRADAAWVAHHVKTTSIDLGRSPVLLDARGRSVALALLAVRGNRGWIGGFGVIPELRGRHVASQLMHAILEQAAGVGLAGLTLEVFRHNVPAVRAYSREGFTISRDLCIFEGRSPVSPRREPSVRDIAPGEIVAAARRCSAGSCWQREPASLAATPDMRGLAVNGDPDAGYLLFLKRKAGVHIADIWVPAGDVRSAERLIDSLGPHLAGASRVTLFNEPAESAASTALLGAGWVISGMQHEMQLQIS